MDLPRLLLGLPAAARPGRDPGIGNDEIERDQLVNFLHPFRQRLSSYDIKWLGKHFCPTRLAVTGHFGQAGRVSSGQGKGHARRRVGGGQGLADATGGAGDQDCCGVLHRGVRACSVRNW